VNDGDVLNLLQQHCGSLLDRCSGLPLKLELLSGLFADCQAPSPGSSPVQQAGELLRGLDAEPPFGMDNVFFASYNALSSSLQSAYLSLTLFMHNYKDCIYNRYGLIQRGLLLDTAAMWCAALDADGSSTILKKLHDRALVQYKRAADGRTVVDVHDALREFAAAYVRIG
jgi:hypothetical protein